MYKALSKISNFPSSQTTSSVISSSASTTTTIPEDEFLSEAFFAGDSFLSVEAAYGRINGVVKTATGFCGGTLKKPSYKDVTEGKTGHTEAVKVTYDTRKISYKSLCDLFWESHDPTNRIYLSFGIKTHLRSVIFYSNEEERKQAQESKIRKQMRLNKRIVTKIASLLGFDFFVAENNQQKYYLQQKTWLCLSLGLRSTEHFVESNIACKLNGILAMEGPKIIDQLTTFLKTHEMPKQAKSVCEEIILELTRKDNGFANPRAQYNKIDF